MYKLFTVSLPLIQHKFLLRPFLPDNEENIRLRYQMLCESISYLNQLISFHGTFYYNYF
jgi:hypothetical protein